MSKFSFSLKDLQQALKDSRHLSIQGLCGKIPLGTYQDSDGDEYRVCVSYNGTDDMGSPYFKFGVLDGRIASFISTDFKYYIAHPNEVLIAFIRLFNEGGL